MENFIAPTQEEQAREAISHLKNVELVKLSIPYDPDAMTFSFLVSKLVKRTSISWRGTEGDVILRKGERKTIMISGTVYDIGRSSFSSLVPVSFEDVEAQLAAFSASWMIERREATQWELKIVRGMEKGGVKVEKGLRLPAYNDIPLYSSILMSVNPLLMSISGNREASLKLVKEVGGDETTYLRDLSEERLKRLVEKLSQFTNEQLISTRIFVNEKDVMELGLGLLYFFDVEGSTVPFRIVHVSGYSRYLISRYRRELVGGFQLECRKEGGTLVVKTGLRSPLFAEVACPEKGEQVLLETPSGLFSSRYFLEFEGEGLVRVRRS
ncbi:hypothetical protein HS1genome_2337 [Sulfodiicoccus acidiphilus]|uniref:Single-stranded DNA exonuclease n=1 Tax=Sulfodiicoccus acidiphilus TaxID=1670455 RepID=A0A348B6Z6_9CREN|nr:hypothetical protein [Sulfodiicoccus acidiphilus]BBD73948.1 hypothetical protein HS1genome_2337 [Sulfodiicoccus acidiphilus]GGU03249.1 hypothetical protein GCM10007116_20240 [Sulfodiicoccus acidiphilus]